MEGRLCCFQGCHSVKKRTGYTPKDKMGEKVRLALAASRI